MIGIGVGLVALLSGHLVVDGKRPAPPLEEVKPPETAEHPPMPPDSEIEAFYRDNAGSTPVSKDFDSPPGEICGNGKSYYWTSIPPKKPVPKGWRPPPRPGEDPSYTGPKPGEPFKESPYAMPSSKRVLARKRIRDRHDKTLFAEIRRHLVTTTKPFGYLDDVPPDPRFKTLGRELKLVDAEAFDTDQHARLAKLLLKQGMEYLLVDRTSPPVSAWVDDKTDTVRVRLRDAIGTAWFHPVVLGSRYVLFRIRPPLIIPEGARRAMTKRVRARLTGSPLPEVTLPSELPAVGGEGFRVIVSLRSRGEKGLKGRKLVKRMSRDDNLIAAMDGAAEEIVQDWQRVRERAAGDPYIDVDELSANIGKAVGSMEIEVEVLYDQCIITDRTLSNLVWHMELGVEGLSLEKGGRFHYLEPAYAVHMGRTSERRFLRKFLRKSGKKELLRRSSDGKWRIDERAWKEDTSYRFGRFRVLHWVETPSHEEIVGLYRGVPLKRVSAVSRDALVESLRLGAAWLLAHQSDDGQYAYKYKPLNKPGRRWTDGGNIVRHALNPYTLLMVNRIDPDERYVESAKRGIAFTLKFLRRQGDRCVICHRDPPARYYNAKLGTVAVTILSILKLGDAADIGEYDETLRCLARELLYLQDPNGHFWCYDVPPAHPYYGAENTIAPGELIFALARMYSRYEDERYKEAIDRALDFYMASWRKLQKEKTPQGIYDEEHRVNLIGIVPWLVTAMNDLYVTTRDRKYAAIAFEMQDWIDERFFLFPERSAYPDYVGASFKTHFELPAINSCQYSEGAAAAFNLAKLTKTQKAYRRRVLVLGMRFCLQLQYDSYGNTFFLPVPDEAMGGYRYTIGHTRLRNDYSYHAMAAIAQAVEYLGPEDYPSRTAQDIPRVFPELMRRPAARSFP